MIAEHTVRESARAKHVRLRVSVSDGLVVVVPKGFDRRRIPRYLEANRAWIDRAFREIEAERAAVASNADRPTSIELPAVEQVWHLEWIETESERISVSAIGSSRLRLSGSIGDRSAWRPALRLWLIERGRKQLVPWVEGMADAFGVRIDRISIRCQKTRWGSYTAKNGQAGTVSLNAQLLFLPRRLVRYVLTHELCHAVHPNHSAGFWELVRSHEPKVDRLRTELRNARGLVPTWMRAGR